MHDPKEEGTQSGPWRPRPDDHRIEPMFAAVHVPQAQERSRLDRRWILAAALLVIFLWWLI